ncbi:hypothetical protein [Fodinibius sp.]|nr:hypothetical protein [Fodinibius sp.]
MAHSHWEYFLAIEEDVVRSSRFVELEAQSFDSDSIEFARSFTCERV